MCKSKFGRCAYCGTEGPITRDHVPPQCLFARPKPKTLITVPSCQACNHGSSKDDEYLRLMLSMEVDNYTHPDVRSFWPEIMEKLQKPEKSGLRKALLDNLRIVEVKMPSGLYLGDHPMYDVDLVRLNGLVGKIFKGLYYHMKQKPLPKNYWVDSRYVPSKFEVVADQMEHYLSVVRTALQGQKGVLGDDVFTYGLNFCSDDACAFVGTAIFYRSVAFLGFCIRQGD